MVADTTDASVVDVEVLCGPTTTSLTIPIRALQANDDVESDHCSSSDEKNTEKLENHDGALLIQAPAQPCPSECGACTSVFSRRYRTREQADLPLQSKVPRPAKIQLSWNEKSQVAAGNSRWLNIYPRAPPTLPL
jgi:hypothetical protein